MTWAKDIEHENILRAPDCALLPSLVDYQVPFQPYLSVIIYNMMLQRYGSNTQSNWCRTLSELYYDLAGAAQCMLDFYNQGYLDLAKSRGSVPNGRLDLTSSHLQMDRNRFRKAGELLYYIASQPYEHEMFRGTDFPQETLMKIVVDFNAYHKQEPIPSYVRVEKQKHPPGYLYDDITEDATIDQLEITKSYDYHRPSGKSTVALGYVADQRDATSTRKSCLARPEPGKGVPARAGGLGGSSLQTRRERGIKRLRFTSPLEYYASPRFEPSAGRKKLFWRVLEQQSWKGLTAGDDDTGHEPHPNEKTATGAFHKRDPKRRRLHRLIEDGQDEELATAGRTDGVASQRLGLFEEDPSESQLRISEAKRQELHAVRQQRIEAEEAERLQREEAERLRREEEERKLEAERVRKERAAALLRTGLRPPTRSVIAPMSEEWLARVRDSVDAPPSAELVESPEGSALRSKDFATVVPPTQWLNDEIVNGALIHLSNHINNKAKANGRRQKCHAFTSFFWGKLSTQGAEGTARWMKRQGVTKDNFLDMDTVLIPICKNFHWTLVVVRPTQRTIAHMDSMGPGGAGKEEVTKITYEWVKGVLKEKWTEDWRVVRYASPGQTNGWDCGVHAVTNAMFVALGLDPSHYRPEQMPLQRYRIAGTLLNGGFTGDFDLVGL